MAGESDTTTSDGRSLRRSRNRDAVLDAVIASFEEGDIDPSIDAVAKRAGVSNRSIYRYFDHRDHLIRAAVSHAMRRLTPVVTLSHIGIGSFDQRVERFIDHRFHKYHRLAPISRAAKLVEASEPIVAEELQAERVILRQTLQEHFAEEFAALAPANRERSLILIEVVFQFEAFEFLTAATAARVDDMRTILVEHLNVCLRGAGRDASLPVAPGEPAAIRP